METVQISNLSKKILIAQEGQLAVSFSQRLKGLLGKTELSPNEAMVLRPCTSIHTFFMRFSIDVLFLDRNMQVIWIISNMRPNRLSPLLWRSNMAIELPSGKIDQTNTKIGDIIELK